MFDCTYHGIGIKTLYINLKSTDVKRDIRLKQCEWIFTKSIFHEVSTVPTSNDVRPILPEAQSPRRSGWNRTRVGGIRNRWFAAVARLIHAVGVEIVARRSIRRLAGMSEHGLCDLGLSRGDIERVARPVPFPLHAPPGSAAT